MPQPSDPIGAYSTKQLERMNQEFTAAVEHAQRAGGGTQSLRTPRQEVVAEEVP